MKRMLKKITIGLMLVCSIFSLFTGCKVNEDSSNSYTITLNYKNGGYSILKKNKGDSLNLSKYDLDRPGYSFVGWDYDDSKKIDRDCTIDALWKGNKYKIYYHSNNQDDLIIEQDVVFNESVILKDNIFTLSNHVLKSWYYVENNRNVYCDLEETIEHYNFLGDLHLYAKWESFDSNKYQMDYNYVMPTVIDWIPDDNGCVTVDIPKVFATNTETSESMSVDCEVKSPYGDNLSVEYYSSGEGKDGLCYFVATIPGIYYIKYIATDSSNNQKILNCTIQVGDCEKPTLKWLNGFGVISKLYKGDYWAFDLNTLQLLDNHSSSQALLERLTIKLITPNGLNATNIDKRGNRYVWKFDEEGKYSLKIIVKDEAGNESVYVYGIYVQSLSR